MAPSTLEATRRQAGLDFAGLVLFTLLAVWVMLAAAVSGGDPYPMASLTLGTAVALFGARAVSRRHDTAVPAAVAIAVALAAAFAGRDALANTSSPLGYQNATAALYVIGAAAAGLVAVRADRRTIRRGFALLALVLAVLPWLADATGGAVTGTIVVMAVGYCLTRPEPSGGAVVRMATVTVLVAVAATIAAGVTYDRGREPPVAEGLTERRLVLWSEALTLVAEQPLFGVGPGRFAVTSPTARSDPDARWAHHEPLQVAAETGVPGLLLLVALVLWGLRWVGAGGAPGRTIALVLLAVAFAHACVDYLWHAPLVPLALGTVVGSAFGTSNPRGVR